MNIVNFFVVFINILYTKSERERERERERE